jgi:hypothetical protein
MEKPQASIDMIKKEMTQLDILLKEAEKNEATLSGRLQEALKGIKAEFGVDSIEELEKEKTKEEATAEKLRISVTQKFSTLSEAYQW